MRVYPLLTFGALLVLGGAPALAGLDFNPSFELIKKKLEN